MATDASGHLQRRASPCSQSAQRFRAGAGGQIGAAGVRYLCVAGPRAVTQLALLSRYYDSCIRGYHTRTSPPPLGVDPV